MDAKFVDLDRWRRDVARNFMIAQQYLIQALAESLQTGELPSVVTKLRALDRITPGREEEVINEVIQAHIWTEINRGDAPPSLEYCRSLDEVVATEEARNYLENLIKKNDTQS